MKSPYHQISPKKLKPNPDNPRFITAEKREKLMKSFNDLTALQRLRPILVDDNMMVLGGNQRLDAALALKQTNVYYDVFTREMAEEMNVKAREEGRPERTYEYYCAQIVITDNSGFGEYDMQIIDTSWMDYPLEDWGFDIAVWTDNDEEVKTEQSIKEKLNDQFVIPPFSVFDTKLGYWKDRKRAWLDIIKEKGESRENTLFGDECKDTDLGKQMRDISSVSILDPVLAEIVNRWFGLNECKTFDPFAGDSVFGYVSDYLGHTFTGIELRQEQVDINNSRLPSKRSKYICDDAQNVLKHIKENSQDLLFSCPPYFDLEVYSDLENDASNQETYEDFLQILDNGFSDAIKCLKDDRFAVITVGDVRNKKNGAYYGFVDDIKQIFKRNGMYLYNDIVLINPYGTAPQRAGRQMRTRKLVKVHQNVLVFYKGDTKSIKNNYHKLDPSQFDIEADETE